MGSLEGFSNAAAPVFADLGKAAPSLTSATRALTPFSAASTVSLKSLGATGEVAGPKLRAADPIVRKASELAISGADPTTELAKFLVSTEKTKGFKGLSELIYNSAGANNEFDQYGHFGRAVVALTNCIDYVVAPTSGCSANFNGPESGEGQASAFSSSAFLRRVQRMQERLAGGTSPPASASSSSPESPVPAKPEAPSLGESRQLGAAAKPASPRRALLDYLLAP